MTLKSLSSNPPGAFAASAKPSLAKTLSRRVEARMVVLAVLMGLALSGLSPVFLTSANLSGILDQSAVIGIVAVGMTFVILTGGIDLSVGAVAGLTGAILGQLVQHMPVPAAIALAVCGGGGIGLVSGLLINGLGLSAALVTLGVMATGRSLASALPMPTEMTDAITALRDVVEATVLGIPAKMVMLFMLYGMAWAYLTSTKGGRTVYAIGSNRKAARAAGLRTLLYSVLPYVLSGALSAVAVTISMRPIASAGPPMSLDLDAIAAVLIGGVRLSGGRGSVIGTLIGVFILVMIRNGLTLLGLSPLWQGSAIGLIIIVALVTDRLRSGSPDR